MSAVFPPQCLFLSVLFSLNDEIKNINEFNAPVITVTGIMRSLKDLKKKKINWKKRANCLYSLILLLNLKVVQLQLVCRLICRLNKDFKHYKRRTEALAELLTASGTQKLSQGARKHVGSPTGSVTALI